MKQINKTITLKVTQVTQPMRNIIAKSQLKKNVISLREFKKMELERAKPIEFGEVKHIKFDSSKARR